MTDAVGVHAHPNLKLGRRPPKRAEALKLADFLTAVPDHPLTDPPPALGWPMDRNDQAGDCVVAGLDHTLQAICAQLGVTRANWTDGELLAYYQTQNPGFKSWADAGGANDNGMDIQTFLEYLVKKGVILGFAAIDPKNAVEVQAGIYIGLGIVTGENLTVAQQTQQVWDYVASSAGWGGHCTTWVGYNLGQDVTVTWGTTLPMTPAFITHQVEEAWFVVTQAHVDHPGFRNAFDLSAFAAAYTQITGGRPFPVVVPPAPAPPAPPPAPSPTPTPAGAATYTVADPAVNTHVASAAKAGKWPSVDAWLTHHLQSYFHLPTT